MEHTICDRCGAKLPDPPGVRYEVRIEVKAAYDPLALTAEDVGRDYGAEIEALLRQLDGLSAEEAQDQVYRLLEYDLCVACQRRYLRNPLGADDSKAG
jgi:ribosomal protein L40E